MAVLGAISFLLWVVALLVLAAIYKRVGASTRGVDLSAMKAAATAQAPPAA